MASADWSWQKASHVTCGWENQRKICHAGFGLIDWLTLNLAEEDPFFFLKCELRDFCAFLFSPGSSRMSSSSEPSSSSSSSFAFLLTVEHYKCQRIATSDFSFIFMNALNFSSGVGGIYTHPLY